MRFLNYLFTREKRISLLIKPSGQNEFGLRALRDMEVCLETHKDQTDYDL